jgi:hypothetical protein
MLLVWGLGGGDGVFSPTMTGILGGCSGHVRFDNIRSTRRYDVFMSSK